MKLGYLGCAMLDWMRELLNSQYDFCSNAIDEKEPVFIEAEDCGSQRRYTSSSEASDEDWDAEFKEG